MNIFSFWKPKSLNGSLSGIYSEDEFKRIIVRECLRCDRNGSIFSLVIFDMNEISKKDLDKLLKKIVNIRGLRSIDEVGMIENKRVGICLHNTDKAGALSFAKNIHEKFIVTEKHNVNYMIYVYPSDRQYFNDLDANLINFQKNKGFNKQHRQITGKSFLADRDTKKVFSRVVFENELKKGSNHTLPFWKRFIDIIVSSLILVVTSPLLLIIAVFIKIVSPGPVLFKQTRVGYMGKKFSMLKFRSMTVGNDTNAHKEYLSKLINGKKYRENYIKKPMTKRDDLNNLIPYGKVFRRLCLDELPQLINVLRGEMSLIGPRPPVLYEVKEYRNWHNRRFETLPGLTGLWQVSGKNRLTFDQMIRLDIRYSQEWSFWLDLKIFLLTPFAILFRTT